jgi:hypothetical protein
VGHRAGLDRFGKSPPHRDSITDRPARSSVAIPTELPGSQIINVVSHYSKQKRFEGNVLINGAVNYLDLKASTLGEWGISTKILTGE